MIELKNASLSLGGKQLFRNLSLMVNKGEILCVSGISGVGKTSLLRAVLGFLPLDSGYITIDGEPVTAASAETFRRMMAYVPQELALPHEEVKEMVEVPFLLKANDHQTFTKSKLMHEWTKLGLEAALYDKKVSEVSGGQRQRIMLSVAGLLQKSILLVDEPTSALDTDSSVMVADYLRELARGGAMIIAVSHDEAFASRCDKIVKLEIND